MKYANERVTNIENSNTMHVSKMKEKTIKRENIINETESDQS